MRGEGWRRGGERKLCGEVTESLIAMVRLSEVGL